MERSVTHIFLFKKSLQSDTKNASAPLLVPESVGGSGMKACTV